jgi:hypothetical protein
MDERPVLCTDQLTLRSINQLREIVDAQSTLSGGNVRLPPHSVEDKYYQGLHRKLKKLGLKQPEMELCKRLTRLLVQFFSESIDYSTRH